MKSVATPDSADWSEYGRQPSRWHLRSRDLPVVAVSIR